MHMYNSDFISVQSKIDLSGLQGDPFKWYTNASHATPECSAQTILIKKLFSYFIFAITSHHTTSSSHATSRSNRLGRTRRIVLLLG